MTARPSALPASPARPTLPTPPALPVAATFSFARDDGASLGDLARLDTMVTVVDAAAFLTELGSGDELAERGLDQYEDDQRTVSDLLIDQIEFADVIILNKVDLVTEEDADQVAAALGRLNPAAEILRAAHGRVPPARLLGTGLFDLDKAQQAPGWAAELNGDHVPETEEYDISSLVFRADRPFHPQRLWDLVCERLDSGEFGTVLRSKGFFRLASRPRVVGLWSQAGAVARFEPAADAAATDADEAPRPMQELVFIGIGLRADALRSALFGCLADPAKPYPTDDPFPEWGRQPQAHTQVHAHSHAHAHAHAG